MKHSTLRPVAIACLTFCLLLLVVPKSGGAEMQFAGDNFAITPPEGWDDITKAANRPGLLAAFGRPDKTGLLLVMADDKNVANGPLDDKFMTEFDRGVESGGGGKRLSGKFIEVAGIKSYERLGEAAVAGKPTSVLMRVIPVAGRIYHLQGMSLDGKRADETPELMKALDSFRFLQAPKMVSADPLAGQSASYRAGYIAGRWGIWIFFGLLIVMFFRWVLKRKTPPPPLPR